MTCFFKSPILRKIKVDFIYKVWFVFFKSPNLRKMKYSRFLSWAWNLNFPPITVNNEFQAQDSNSEHFSFWNWEIWKRNHTFWKKVTFRDEYEWKFTEPSKKGSESNQAKLKKSRSRRRPGVTRCWKMATLSVEVSVQSAIGEQQCTTGYNHCMCRVVGWLIVDLYNWTADLKKTSTCKFTYTRHLFQTTSF